MFNNKFYFSSGPKNVPVEKAESKGSLEFGFLAEIEWGRGWALSEKKQYLNLTMLQ